MKRRSASFANDQLGLFDRELDSLSPADEELRQRFIAGVDKNFSIVAPAGVGKTQSIVERIVAIARHEQAALWLPRLVVVTYTKRAADEMQQRAREEILRAGVCIGILEQFNRAFFGTIHSFCVELLRNFGHHLGLPSKFELVEKDDELWLDFVQQTVTFGGLTAEQRRQFSRHAPLQKVLRLARTLAVQADNESALPDCRDIVFDELLGHAPSGRGKANIAAAQDRVREWQKLYCEDEAFLPVPRIGRGGERFEEVWRKTFAPFREWLCRCALRVAKSTAAQYRGFRVSRGALTYDDQIALASDLLRHSAAARQIRERGYRVILDEAQDTDAAQFHVLLECARALDADTDWQESRINPPEPGRFSMVGDPQQSIYTGRTDLARYGKIRELLGAAPAGTELRFTTTFRCDEAIIDFVNATFPVIFNAPEQVEFVALNPRPQASRGQVVRFQFTTPEAMDPKMPDRKRAMLEASALAKWIVQSGLGHLRATSWSEVAILVPQKRWLSPLRVALREVGVSTQVQSPRDIKGDSPAHAWLTALVLIAANPKNSFEIFGVLRELFGISDDELARFSGGNGYLFRIDRESDGVGSVVDALNLLARARREIERKPLRDAVDGLIAATKLRARLASLPQQFFENTAPQLDDLLALASSAEAEGETLAQFAETLRRDFATVRETQPTESHAIQLLTCHKAKGLQWDAVILPFFHRRLYPPRTAYPRLHHAGPDLPAIVALEGDDVSPRRKDVNAMRDNQERERLLYVSLTRARHTLVLADDAELFQRGGNVARCTLASALRRFTFERHGGGLRSSPGPNEATWQRLGHELTVGPDPVEPADVPPAKQTELVARIPTDGTARALQCANEFPRRTLPSSFAAHRRSDEKWRLDREPEWGEAATGSAAIAYGTWWHALMQSLPGRDAAARASLVTAALEISPDRTRSLREWELFDRSELARRIFAGEETLHAEMPLLWRKSVDECVEGVIDLALFAPATGEWLIVDWKTDLVDAPDSLREAYGGQVAAYVEAIAAITRCSARGGLYSTATGAWLSV